MRKCDNVHCDQDAVGAYVEIKPAGDHTNPHATAYGGKTAFCEQHRDEAVRKMLPGGKFMTIEQAEAL